MPLSLSCKFKLQRRPMVTAMLSSSPMCPFPSRRPNPLCKRTDSRNSYFLIPLCILRCRRSPGAWQAHSRRLRNTQEVHPSGRNLLSFLHWILHPRGFSFGLHNVLWLVTYKYKQWCLLRTHRVYSKAPILPPIPPRLLYPSLQRSPAANWLK